MVVTSFNSLNSLGDSWRKIEQQTNEIRRTEIAVVQSTVYIGGNIQVNVANVGQIDFSKFSEWDIIAERQSGGTGRVKYIDSLPGSNEWTIEGLYLSDNSTVEIFDPGILNPGEVLKISINLDPVMIVGETVRLSVTTPNGITAQLQVTKITPP